MMKLNTCFWLTSVLLLFVGIQTYGCGPFEYYPYGYKMYRVYDKSAVVKPDERKENCILWQKLTSVDIPLDDIEQVVYKYTIAQMKEVMTVHDPNAFASWIREHNDYEIYEFLLLAKKCEYSRGMLNDPWYYPSKNDGTYMSLREIVDKAQAYDETRLHDRYALQAVRAMFSARQYQECIEYWNSIEDSLADGLIKEMTRSYIVGALSRTGQTDYALKYFTDAKDLWSIIYCLKSEGKVIDNVGELEYIAKYAPESDQVTELLQDVITAFEPWGAIKYTYRQRGTTTMVDEWSRDKFDRLYQLSTSMAKRKSSANCAAWCYTAAFLADLDARPNEAWNYVLQAEDCPSSSFMKESIRVLKMYLDAKIGVYDASYESRLYNDLRWLESKIKGNITKEVRENVADSYCYRSADYNISFYYWNDMMRRILLSEICPRMLDRGMPIRALQLANMADNHLLNLVDSIEGKTLEEYRRNCSYNHIDYCGDFFYMMLDAVSINELIAYAKRASSSNIAFDKFLNSNGYINQDYFNDIIGTRYLSEMNYSRAVQYLSKVSSTYQSMLNTEEYMHRDPFSLEGSRLPEHKDYKLSFAQEMLRLERAINTSTDNNSKAFDMIKYGIGIRNSFTNCWTLTEYKRESWPSDLAPSLEPVFSKVESIFNSALSIVENDELAAAAHVKLCKWKTASEKYPDTYAVKYTKMVCDGLCDYSTRHVITHTSHGIWE